VKDFLLFAKSFDFRFIVDHLKNKIIPYDRFELREASRLLISILNDKNTIFRCYVSDYNPKVFGTYYTEFECEIKGIDYLLLHVQFDENHDISMLIFELTPKQNRVGYTINLDVTTTKYDAGSRLKK
jgi:hypothetical protein